MITIPTVATIRDQIVTDIEGKIGQTIPAVPRAFFRVLATAIAGVIALVYRFGAWVYEQIFPQTAGPEALVRIGEQYGIIRQAAVAAVLSATAAGTNSTVIPGGTLWQAGGLVYQQSGAVTISGGTATITIEALVAGESSNLGDGATISLVTPIGGIDSEATVDSTITTGVNTESLENYRSRVLTRLQQRPQGGAAADYIGWAREVPGIVKAFAFRTAPGDVTVYPLVSLTGNRIPDAPKLAEVEAYLQDTIRRPLCANVYAAAMTEATVDITVTSLNPDNTQTRQAIQAAWESYLLGRYPKQYTDEANPTNQIARSLLVAEGLDAGARILEVTMEVDAVPSIFYELADDELAKLGTITWPS